MHLIFYNPLLYAVPTATQNDGHNLFFVLTIVTVTGWVVVGSLKSVFSAFSYTYTPVITYECILWNSKEVCAMSFE